MSVVDNLARKNAEAAVMSGLQEMAAVFTTQENWLNVATRHFMGALVGRSETPRHTADQIAKAFEAAIQGHKYNTPPKPAEVAALARELSPLPQYQKKHSDPTPERQWTDEERARNLARMDEINAYIERQNQDPEYMEALRVHGKGSPELKAIVERQKEEMQRWLKKTA